MTYRIAIVTCSTRRPRLNPFISSYVQSVLSAKPSSSSSSSSSAAAGGAAGGATKDDAEIDLLDIQAHPLPLFDEPGIPQQLPAADPTPHYAHAHTRAWSAAVRRFDAFVFVTPQYNWSVPGALKNAVDYLFHEWAAKPAAIVCYGGRGGGKAGAHLRDILMGLRMVVVEKEQQQDGEEQDEQDEQDKFMVALTKYDVDIAKCEELGVLEPRIVDKWREEGKDRELLRMYEGLMKKLGEKGKG